MAVLCPAQQTKSSLNASLAEGTGSHHFVSVMDLFGPITVIYDNLRAQHPSGQGYYLCFTCWKLRPKEADGAVKVTQKICDRAESWILVSQILSSNLTPGPFCYL